MRSFWSEPFLWIHLAGVATLPIFIEICCLGLAVGVPILPVWLELLLVASVGIIPVLLMQLTRPFYIFSVLLVSLKPEFLTQEQRQILMQFKTTKHQVLAILSAIISVLMLWGIYHIAPIAASIAGFLPQSRLLGLLLAGLAFIASNLFLQIPVSVLGILFTDEAQFANTQPPQVEQISQNFTIPGWQVEKFLPFMKVKL